MNTAVLIDRDGTMGGDYAVKYPQDYAPFPGTREALQILREAGLPAYVITNQSYIAHTLLEAALWISGQEKKQASS